MGLAALTYLVTRSRLFHLRNFGWSRPMVIRRTVAEANVVAIVHKWVVGVEGGRKGMRTGRNRSRSVVVVVVVVRHGLEK
jgi:hypothetical protein